eukprot:Ihof_evm22s2 gene=Ihof_evmTU22s2
MSEEESSRLFNYFLIGGLSPASFDPTIERNIRLHPGDDKNIKKYNGDVLWRYPATDYKDTILPSEAVLEFCFPDKLDISTSYITPKFHTFAMTDEMGTRSYGGCLIFYEPLDSNLVRAYMKKGNGWDRGERRRYNGEVVISRKKWVEGEVEVMVTFNNTDLYFSRPPVNHYHPVITDFCYEILFSRLSVPLVVDLVTHALLEHRIIFFSEHTSVLHPAAECLISLLYPFYWYHVYIPVLPTSMLSFVQAPMPFIAGVNSIHKADIMAAGELVDGLVYVDLDNHTLTSNGGPYTGLPPLIHTKLLEKLSAAVCFAPNKNITKGVLGHNDEAFDISMEKDGEYLIPKLRYSPLKNVSANKDLVDVGDYTASPGCAPSILERQRMRAIHIDPAIRILPQRRSSSPLPLNDGILPESNQGTFGIHRFEQVRNKTCSVSCGPCGPRFEVEVMKDAFLNVLVTLLLGYRDYMKEDGTFNSEGYLLSVDKDMKDFVSEILQTQGFFQFIVERGERDPNDFEVLFFDENIKKKMNRSVTRTIGKLSTPFLNDVTTYGITSTYKALPPDCELDGQGVESVVIGTFMVNTQSLVGSSSLSTAPPTLSLRATPSLRDLDLSNRRPSAVTMSGTEHNIRNMLLRGFPTNMREELLTPRLAEVLVDTAEMVKLKHYYDSKCHVNNKPLHPFPQHKTYKLFLQSYGEQEKSKRQEAMVARLMEIHQKIENAALTGVALETASMDQVEWAIKCLTQHQNLVRETTDMCEDSDEVTEAELQLLLQSLMNHLVKHEDRRAVLIGQGKKPTNSRLSAHSNTIGPGHRKSSSHSSIVVSPGSPIIPSYKSYRASAQMSSEGMSIGSPEFERRCKKERPTIVTPYATYRRAPINVAPFAKGPSILPLADGSSSIFKSSFEIVLPPSYSGNSEMKSVPTSPTLKQVSSSPILKPYIGSSKQLEPVTSSSPSADIVTRGSISDLLPRLVLSPKKVDQVPVQTALSPPLTPSTDIRLRSLLISPPRSPPRSPLLIRKDKE